MRLRNSKAWLYVHTFRYMKPSQVYYRFRKMAGIECGIGTRASVTVEKVHTIESVPELDLDPFFLSRFNVPDMMRDILSFLHSEASMNWEGKWEFKEKSPLWNYNLHYFEFLFPLLSEYRKEKDQRYLQKAVFMIGNWIANNPQKEKGPGWDSYTIDLRITNWLSFYSLTEQDLTGEFKLLMRSSIAEQYAFLSRHIEKDILGNHYFEDLKTLILCAVFFEDRRMLETAYSAFLKECKEEILEDGVHFELSPMYHNIILEGLIKTYVALKEYGYSAYELKKYIQSMLDAAWSMEESIDRLPLFNDCGNNVAKSLSALVSAAENHLGIHPTYKSMFPDAGYYIFKSGDWKLIVDAGQPGPTYIPGHAHCDALSFELYKKGEPVVTNCGTYAYQSSKRNVFRQTGSHNTVMINGNEQSELWATFRMARRCSVRVIDIGSDHITMELKDYVGGVVQRTIQLGEKLTISDVGENTELTGFLHFLIDIPVIYSCIEIHRYVQSYSADYGITEPVDTVSYKGKNHIRAEILLYDNQRQI